jgi:hypothetical protein
VILCALGAAAGAQEIKPDQPEVRPRPPSEPIKPTRTAPGGVAPSGLREDSIPGLEDADFRIGRPVLRAEGTFLVQQRGTVLTLSGGERVMVFYPGENGRRERPMVLLPCQALQRMEQATADRADPVDFIVSGQVYVYLGVNYLLPTQFRVALGEKPVETMPAEPKPTPAPDTTKPADKPASPPKESDPDVQQLIRDLQSQREAQRAAEIGVPVRAPEPKPTEADSSLLTEGLMIVRRRGRLLRTGASEWTFRFDKGTGGSDKIDRPLLVIPSLNLQRMEAWTLRRGEEMTLELSGRVLAYQGKNYIIPIMFQVYPDNDLEPRQ